ncbi:hypothetical protein GCM10010399_47650 [Dactylosporangium fulvum]|uniref:DUF304 domain-containing protein n=1 Tax=Dactylosporangium fulvum TaxID=53359 RepID=A0ABY5VTI1_9ACTN|nr:hypothetical protein [Dactylosporangium fulvum]UWP80421.1 hypothetical protein Dfulv_35405 [Dactylosporangium fulvum]
MLFRSSAGRVVAVCAGTAFFVWLSISGFHVGLTALLGGSAGRAVDSAVLPQFWLYPVMTVSVVLGMRIRNPHWVRLSAVGVEIGTTYAQAVLIPWSGVESATVRGRSVLAFLDIVPHSAAMISLQDGKGRLPPMRRRGGRWGYPVGAGFFPGGPGEVMAALRARGVPDARPYAPVVGSR